MFKNWQRQNVFILSVIVALAIGASILFSCVKKQSELIQGQFETAFVDKGTVETWEPAEGVVEPANEILLLSPSSSLLKEIHKEPGQKVEKGEIILQLDTKALEDKIDNINDQLEVKRNNLHKTQLSARSTRVDLAYNAEVKKLKIASIKSVIADQQQLLEVGGISPARFEESKQQLVLAEKDLELVNEKNAIRLAQLDADEKGLLLQIEMQEKDLQNQLELLERMSLKAPAAGIILEVHGKEGEKVGTDKLLVNMSDLTRFKIRSTMEDDFRDLIKTGRRAYILVNDQRLEGRIGTISPALKDDQIQFYVRPIDNAHPNLIPNQKVALQIISSSKRNVLRIRNGEAFSKDKQQDIFSVQNASATRKPIHFGLITDEYLEIKSGVSEGELLITSSTSPFRHLTQVEIKNQ